jgi:hypothetical protein
MRIRTVKPEFWSHRKTGRLSAEAKCLAIGLLNMADDEGYFEADPLLIRSALFPFDDASTNVRRLIVELSRIDYIEVRENEEQGIYVGKVISFQEHQVIDRAKPSKLKNYYESTTNRRIIDEQSLRARVRNREQGTGKGKEKEPPLTPPGGNSEGSEIVARLNALFNRKPSTLWGEKEMKTLKALGKIDLKEFSKLERYYEAERAKGKNGIHRRDLPTLLNNFLGEMDRARSHAATEERKQIL